MVHIWGYYGRCDEDFDFIKENSFYKQTDILSWYLEFFLESSSSENSAPLYGIRRTEEDSQSPLF